MRPTSRLTAEGYTDGGGSLLWPYTSVFVSDDYIASLTLVDGNGTAIFPGHTGCSGLGDTWDEFLSPYMDVQKLPAELWLALEENGTADMPLAIRVK